jgi:hypothetical protein
MDKIITTISEYNLELHKLILGVHTDKDGKEFTYQPERLNPETLDKEKDDEMGRYYLSNIRITEMR